VTHSQQCHIYDAVIIATNMYINIFIYHYKIWLSFREQQEKISTLTFSICRLAFRTDQTAVDKAYTVHTRSILNTYY